MKVRKGLSAKIMALFAVIMVTAVIFYNSLEDVVASHRASDIVIDAILPQQKAEDGSLELLVRKLAHLVEYTALGFAVMLLARQIGKNAWGFACFYALAVAVIDEHIQSLSDRTSSTGDIILDFCGTLVGFFLGWLAMWLYTRTRARKHEKET